MRRERARNREIADESEQGFGRKRKRDRSGIQRFLKGVKRKSVWIKEARVSFRGFFFFFLETIDVWRERSGGSSIRPRVDW